MGGPRSSWSRYRPGPLLENVTVVVPTPTGKLRERLAVLHVGDAMKSSPTRAGLQVLTIPGPLLFS